MRNRFITQEKLEEKDFPTAETSWGDVSLLL